MLVGRQQETPPGQLGQAFPVPGSSTVQQRQLDRRCIGPLDFPARRAQLDQPLDLRASRMGGARAKAGGDRIGGGLQLVAIAGKEVVDHPEPAIGPGRGGIGQPILQRRHRHRRRDSQAGRPRHEDVRDRARVDGRAIGFVEGDQASIHDGHGLVGGVVQTGLGGDLHPRHRAQACGRPIGGDLPGDDIAQHRPEPGQPAMGLDGQEHPITNKRDRFVALVAADSIRDPLFVQRNEPGRKRVEASSVQKVQDGLAAQSEHPAKAVGVLRQQN